MYPVTMQLDFKELEGPIKFVYFKYYYSFFYSLIHKEKVAK